MNKKVIIQICMGSSCFSRGNGNTLRIIQTFLKKHHLKEYTVLKGNHCFGACSKGPVVKINDVLHENINPDSILKLLQNTFKQNE